MDSPAEMVSPEDSCKVLETNIMNVIALTAKVVSVMKRQKSGHIIGLSSMAGVIGCPFRGIYSASKFALEGFLESLAVELKNCGIRFVVIFF